MQHLTSDVLHYCLNLHWITVIFVIDEVAKEKESEGEEESEGRIVGLEKGNVEWMKGKLYMYAWRDGGVSETEKERGREGGREPQGGRESQGRKEDKKRKVRTESIRSDDIYNRDEGKAHIYIQHVRTQMCMM